MHTNQISERHSLRAALRIFTCFEPAGGLRRGGSGVRGDARCLRRRIVLHDTGSEVMQPSCLIVVACGTSAETAIPFRRPP